MCCNVFRVSRNSDCSEIIPVSGDYRAQIPCHLTGIAIYVKINTMIESRDGRRYVRLVVWCFVGGFDCVTFQQESNTGVWYGAAVLNVFALLFSVHLTFIFKFAIIVLLFRAVFFTSLSLPLTFDIGYGRIKRLWL